MDIRTSNKEPSPSKPATPLKFIQSSLNVSSKDFNSLSLSCSGKYAGILGIAALYTLSTSLYTASKRCSGSVGDSGVFGNTGTPGSIGTSGSIGMFGSTGLSGSIGIFGSIGESG
ncbi:MAG: hypothetical protein IJE40_00560 [Clostridia bacterium]|nr:hypothetical protein [Clostridia bacterium]